MVPALLATIAVHLLVLVPVITSQNCSTYNPCGSNGYCRDNAAGMWECRCKFWWNGTLCEQQTDDGIQVIVLGVLAGAAILAFYGLALICWIRTREKKEKQVEIKETKLTNVAMINVRQSTRLSTFITAILVIIVAGGTLVVEWSLLQPIHKELVLKYEQNLSLFYEVNPICGIFSLQQFNMITLPVALFLLLVFTIKSKRTSFMRDRWRGHIGPVIPLDFFAHVQRTFAAMVFAVFADEILDIIFQVIANQDPSLGKGVLVTFLWRIVRVLAIGARYYPVLAAVYLDSMLTLVCGTLYAWLNFGTTIVNHNICRSTFYPTRADYERANATTLDVMFDYYGTGSNLIIINLCSNILNRLCLAYINVKLPMLLIGKIRKRIQQRNDQKPKDRLRLTREEKLFLHSSVPHSVEMSYVRNLFRSTYDRSRSHRRLLIARLIPKRIYQWRDDFRFSSRVFCIYAVTVLVLCYITIQGCVQVVPTLAALDQSIQAFVSTVLAPDPNSPMVEFPIPRLTRPYVCAIVIAFLITAIQLTVLLVNIRRNLLQVFRGDDSEIPKRTSSDYVSYGKGNFHFAGYFIGYLVWGYVLIAFIAFLICVCIDAWITFRSVHFLEGILKSIIPTILLIVFKTYVNALFARYVFLQQWGRTFAIDNRRALMIFLYFNFFLDAFLGFVSSIIRIIKSIIGGCVYMCRLDYSPLGRKLETRDAGFSAYCGFIQMEAAHRHPVMLAVASYLYSRMKAKQHVSSSRRPSSRVIRKWHVAILLACNPWLIPLRKAALQQQRSTQLRTIIQQQRRSVAMQQMIHRPSLISEADLRELWQRRY